MAAKQRRLWFGDWPEGGGEPPVSTPDVPRRQPEQQPRPAGWTGRSTAIAVFAGTLAVGAGYLFGQSHTSASPTPQRASFPSAVDPGQQQAPQGLPPMVTQQS